MNRCISFNRGPINTILENVANFNVLFLAIWESCCLSHNKPTHTRAHLDLKLGNAGGHKTDVLGEDKQRAYIILNENFLCLSSSMCLLLSSMAILCNINDYSWKGPINWEIRLGRRIND